MRYVGGKEQEGVWQRIVNLMPPHDVYVEPFLGAGAVLRLKRPALASIGIDKTLHGPAVAHFKASTQPVQFREGCGIEFLEHCAGLAASGLPLTYGADGSTAPVAWQNVLAYCDPPYVLATRKNRRYYKHEMDDAEHLRLLACLRAAPFRWILSGYSSRLYNSQGFEVLTEWCADGIRVESFDVTTRGHSKAREFLWFNFDRPRIPHDVAHVGENHRDRWRIEKRRRRLRARFSGMAPAERATLFLALVDVMRAAGDAVPGVEIGAPQMAPRDPAS